MKKDAPQPPEYINIDSENAYDFIAEHDFFHDAEVQFFDMQSDNTASVTFLYEDDIYYTLNMYGISSYGISIDLYQRWIYAIDFEYPAEGTLINFDNAGMYFVVDKFDLSYRVDAAAPAIKNLLEDMNSFTLKFCDALGMPIDVWKLSLIENGNSYRCTHVKPSITDDNASASSVVSRDCVIDVFRKFNIDTWRGEYKSPEGIFVLDGCKWNMLLDSKYGYTKAHGINGYPEHFDEFCECLTDLCERG